MRYTPQNSFQNYILLYERTSTVLGGEKFRYGFGGMQKDDEIKNIEGSSYDFGNRMYHNRLGVFLSLDSYERLSKTGSKYTYSGNSPIWSVDFAGKYQFPAGSTFEKDYPILTNYLKNDIQSVINNPKIINAMMKYGQMTKKEVISALKWGSGPTINIVDLVGAFGEFTPNSESKEIRLDSDMIRDLENSLTKDIEQNLFLTSTTILHETVHYGDDQDGKDYNGNLGDGEEGSAFEIEAVGEVIKKSTAKKVMKANNWKSNSNIQKLGNIVFDSDKARLSKDKSFFIVKDVKTKKDFGVWRKADGSYVFKKK